jgi:hypothetical protein
MLKKLIFSAGKFLSLSALLLALTLPADAKLFVGAGATFFKPLSVTEDVLQNSLGINAVFELRNYCKLWYGLRFDYFSYQKRNDLVFGTPFFTDALYISPEIRWNIFGDKCYESNFHLYLQGMLTISSIGATDDETRLGLGGAAGLGLAYGFTLFGNPCWLIDLNALYSAPNFIIKPEKRAKLQSINLSLTLSVGL